MRTPLVLVATTVAVLCAGILTGIAGLAMGELVPDRMVARSLHDARVDGSLSPTAQQPTRFGGVADHTTECGEISFGLGESADAGFFETLARGTILGPCERLIAALDSFDRNGQLPEGSTNLRYWHGASTLFRPLLVLVGLPGVRLLSFGVLIAAVASLGRQVRRIAGTGAAVGLLGPVVATTDLAEVGHVAHHALALAVAFGGAGVALRVTQRTPTPSAAFLAALLAGAAFVYVDLLTNAPGAWILVVAMVILAVRSTEARPLRVAGFAVAAGTGWLVGYAGMWAGKWLFAALMLGRDQVWDDVSSTIEKRIDGESQWSEATFGAAIDKNLDTWLTQPLTAVVLLASAVVVSAVLIRATRTATPGGLAVVAVAASPALIPFVWFEIASNHSQIHHWFTYRSLPIALGVALLACLVGNEGRAIEAPR